MHIAYFVHDLADAAVHRRVRMMRNFADVTLLGFHRSPTYPLELDGIPTVNLGHTADARLAHRVVAVFRAMLQQSRWRRQANSSTIFMARQLEMLVLAAYVRRSVAPQAPLVFECLDIHRLMLTPRLIGAVLRTIEERLLRACSLLVVSSPAFVGNHFQRYGASLPPQLLLENKVMADDVPPTMLRTIAMIRTGGPAPVPPWRIGWFGMIRCRRSLAMLAQVLTELPGLVEVIIRGRPRRNVMPDFDAIVSATPGLMFLGEYDRHTDLPSIYGHVHFTWAADFFEAGQNSSWLLPNRLYEGALYGAVPIAPASVETARWLRARQCGVLMDDSNDACLTRALVTFLRRLDLAGYREARAALTRVPLSDILDDSASCTRLGTELQTLGGQSS